MRRVFLYRTRFGRFLFSVSQSSKTILSVSTVRRSSSRFSRQVSSFFLAVSLSTSVLRSSSFSWAMLRRTDLPKESTVRRGLALWAGFAEGEGSSAAFSPFIMPSDGAADRTDAFNVTRARKTGLCRKKQNHPLFGAGARKTVEPKT